MYGILINVSTTKNETNIADEHGDNPGFDAEPIAFDRVGDSFTIGHVGDSSDVHRTNRPAIDPAIRTTDRHDDGIGTTRRIRETRERRTGTRHAKSAGVRPGHEETEVASRGDEGDGKDASARATENGRAAGRIANDETTTQPTGVEPRGRTGEIVEECERAERHS
jgi:hypothetical protein